ncbi:hypothetical protein BDM02DRAFT_3153349 [Thelephora ganbajun]|uniref:Uncharacterized protein n=1 Tax=Thelephora ganbajun TaxID=370292 RepID=A0ACB6ZV04_THEGA|nr:hypothetical protein BDM02DRAFT_3153349 [Thelephora ganbajun]
MKTLFWLLLPVLLTAWAAQAARSVNFQVAQPPIERNFAWFYGRQVLMHFEHTAPAPTGSLAPRSPSTDCSPAGSWAAVTLNFTDVSRYTRLFAAVGTFIFQLDNIVSSTESLRLALVHATFYTSTKIYPPAPTSDIIIPIGPLANNSGAQVLIPPSLSVSVTIPWNTDEICAEMYTSGNSQEEFWYSNVPGKYLGNWCCFPVSHNIYWRWVVSYLLVPSLTDPSDRRPVPSYAILDLPLYYVDPTPFIPLLTDGKPHNITIDVASAEPDHATNSNWIVSANLQVVTRSPSEPTTGNIASYGVESFAQTTTSLSEGSVEITTRGTRKLRIESEVICGDGSKRQVLVTQTSSGANTSSHNGFTKSTDQFSHPLHVNFKAFDPAFNSWETSFDHSYERLFSPSPFALASNVRSHQTAGGYGSFPASNGTNENQFFYNDARGDTCRRTVSAAYNNITCNGGGVEICPTVTFVCEMS